MSYSFKVERYQFVLRSISSMNHQSGVEGNHGVCARKKVMLPDGSFSHVPYVSANAMRNRMRHAAAMATLEAAGLLDGDGPKLSPRAVNLLFGGGALEGGTGSFSSARYLELCDLFPHLRLLGGAAGSQINPGMLRVNDLTLICEETAHSLPDTAVRLGGGHVCDLSCADHCQMRSAGMASAREHIDVQQRVRGDACKGLTGQQMMLDSDRDAMHARRLLRDDAAAAGDGRALEGLKSSQMPYTYETVAEGSLWAWGLSADTTSPLEIDMLQTTIWRTLARLQAEGVGGKTAHGHGRLKLVSAEGLAYRPLKARLAEEDSATWIEPEAWRPGGLFAAHVADRSAAIGAFLRTDILPSEVKLAPAEGGKKGGKKTAKEVAE